MLHTVIFIGRSGCGKGTQARLFNEYIDSTAEHIPTLYVETGEHFRRFIRENTYTSTISNAVNQSGERQPEFLACWMWSNVLVTELEDNMHLVFDGTPRARDEAAVLATALKFYKRERPTVFYIDVSRKWSEEKLLARHRADDVNLAKIDKRLDWFDKDTVPALEYMKSHDLFQFFTINGEQSIEKVHSDIVSAYES